MSDSGSSGPRRPPPHGSGPVTAHSADDLEVYFPESSAGRPVGFVHSAKWRPRADVYELEGELVVQLDVAGMEAGEFTIEFSEGILTISGERRTRRTGRRTYYAMEIQTGPFERRLRVPVPVDPATMEAAYENGMLEVRLKRIPERRAGAFSVRVR
jgi:HSP20 family protein